MRLLHQLAWTTLMILAGGSAVLRAAEKDSNVAPAYYVAEFEVTDPEGMKPYSTMVESTFKPYGGHFIVRGGTTTSLEGSAPTRRRVVIEFENHENAMAWYNSTEYVALRKIRQQSAKTDVYLIDGVAPP